VFALPFDHRIGRDDEAESHEHTEEYPDIAHRRAFDDEAVVGRQHKSTCYGVEDPQPPVANLVDKEKRKRAKSGGDGREKRGKNDGPDTHVGHGRRWKQQ
jgi:hypothetical protein